MAQLLFGRARTAVINILFLDGEADLHVREIARRSGLSAPTIARELKVLEAAGVLKSEAAGRQLFFRPDTSYAFYDELRAIALKSASTSSKPKSRRKKYKT